MKHERRRAAVYLAVQICLIVFTVIPLSFLLFFPERPDEGVQTVVIRYYTTLSNVAAALAAIPAAIFAVRALSGKSGRLPRWLLICRFLATSMLTLTMMTVLCFLGPIYGYGEMYTGVNFWFHLINPVLSVTAFLFLETETAIPFKAAPLGIVPTVLYGLVYVREVVFVGTWPDFYSLNPGGRWVVSVLAMLFADLLLSALLLLARGKPPEESEKTV